MSNIHSKVSQKLRKNNNASYASVTSKREVNGSRGDVIIALTSSMDALRHGFDVECQRHHVRYVIDDDRFAGNAAGEEIGA